MIPGARDRSARLLPRLVFVLALASACYDPVHEDEVAALGGEAPGVRPGPLHRPGQRCTTCHGPDGPGSPEWSVAGTIFAVDGQSQPEVGARVIVTDRLGAERTLVTNAAGNFYVDRKEWDPSFPIRVQVESQGITRGMDTSIGRDGGCGRCHRGVGDRYYLPQISMRTN